MEKLVLSMVLFKQCIACLSASIETDRMESLSRTSVVAKAALSRSEKWIAVVTSFWYPEHLKLNYLVTIN
jgi:hypothetical protein